MSGRCCARLADPGTPVTHETLNGMSPWRSVAYLRDLLMLHGVLPPADRNLMLFERWLGEALSATGQSEHRRLVERFASWHVRRRLRGFAGHGTVTGKQIQQARDEIRLAIAFLAWLHGRGRALRRLPAGRRRRLVRRRLHRPPPDPRLPALGHEQRAPAPAGGPAPGHRQPGADQPAAAPGPPPAHDHRREGRPAHPRRRNPDAAIRPAADPHPRPDHRRHPLRRRRSHDPSRRPSRTGPRALRRPADPLRRPRRLNLTTATNAGARGCSPDAAAASP